MRKKIRLITIFALCIVMACMAGCKKKSGSAKDKPAVSVEPVVTQAASLVVVSEDPEVPSIDIAKLEKLKGIALTAHDRAHNLYNGMLGKEEAILDLWIDKEAQEAQISFVGDYHSEKLTFSCELLEDGVRYHDDNYYILLKQRKEDALTGYFYERGQELEDVTLQLQAINYSEDKEHLYTIGSDKDVEDFAQKVLDSINGYDFKAFSQYVSYPITVHVNQAVQTIEKKEDFEKLGEEVIFTDGFIQAMAVAYPNLMFSNEEDGVMLGSGEYNVWINVNESGEMKVTGINN